MKKYGFARKRMYVLSFVLGAVTVGMIWTASQLTVAGEYRADDFSGRVYKYQLDDYQRASAGNAVKNICRDRVFFKAMEDMGVNIDESEVDREYEDIVRRYGGEDEFESILLDTTQNEDSYKQSIRKGLYRKAAANKYASEVGDISQEEISGYISENPDKTKGLETDEIIEEIKKEKGEELLDKYLEEYQENIIIRSYA